MYKIILVVMMLFSFSLHAFFEKSIFPKKVKNHCEYLWNKGGNGFVVGQFNILIDLKNSSGNLEERAYIFIDCIGEIPKSNKSLKNRLESITTSCMGVRIVSNDKETLNINNIFAIRPGDVEIKSKPKDDKLVLVWDDASIFEIENKKNFSWTMKSRLSGNTHKGFVSCE